jgi:O-antigen/teichoic acid export membrane protein
VLVTNLAWRISEQTASVAITTVVSILLARILGPSEFGVVAMALVLTNILGVVVEGGFGSAIIQKADADDLDYDTVFWINLAVSVFLYGLVVVMAGLIAGFYREPELVSVIRWLGIGVIIGAFRTVQQAHIARRLQFRRFFFVTVSGTFTGGMIGIVGATAGWGVWSLVVQQLVTQGVACVVLWLSTAWRPRPRFSSTRAKRLFGFGSRLLAASLLDSIYNNMRQLVIGRIYSPSDVAFFNRGKSFPYDIVVTVNRSIDSVLFPVLAKTQGMPDQVRGMVRKSIRVSSFVMWPLMVGLSVVAEPLVRMLLTEKWLPCVPILQLSCIAYGLYPVQTANLNALKALGMSRTYLRLELVKKGIGVVLLLASAPFGVLAIVAALVVGSLASTIINSAPNRRILQYSYGQQMKDMFPPLTLAGLSGVLVWPLCLTGLPDAWLVAAQLLAGCLLYLGMSRIARLEGLSVLRSVFVGVVSRHRG